MVILFNKIKYIRILNCIWISLPYYRFLWSTIIYRKFPSFHWETGFCCCITFLNSSVLAFQCLILKEDLMKLAKDPQLVLTHYGEFWYHRERYLSECFKGMICSCKWNVLFKLFLKKIEPYISICFVSCISNICILIMQTSFFVNMLFLLFSSVLHHRFVVCSS